MRVADYVWQFFADRGVRHVFLVTGGNAMHLNDALLDRPEIHAACMHHEQAAAMAAEGYARVEGKVGVLSTSSGPAALNTLSGLYGAYVDSLPVICIAGQSKRELLRAAQVSPDAAGSRQLGVQEADAVATAKAVTKYAATVLEPFQVRYELEKAWHMAVSGRPGPVFIDIPLDVQGSQVDPERLPAFQPLPRKPRPLQKACRQIIGILAQARRPVLVGGEGIREGGATEAFGVLAEGLRIPVVTAWMPDIYPPDRSCYAGRLGTLGTRAGNFTVQNADVLLVVGSRLSIPQVGFNWETFARGAYVISVNPDAMELVKPIGVIDQQVVAEPQEFLVAMADAWAGGGDHPAAWREWLDVCRVRVRRYPEVDLPPATAAGAGIHPYRFVQTLFDSLEDDAFVACGNALSACVAFQAAPLRKSQRLTSNASAGAMGHDLPSAIGSAFARSGQRVICLAGDGSLMMNIQELQTVVHAGLPVGIMVMNNGGYQSIRTTQTNYFGRLIGEGSRSGVSFPDYVRVAEAFGLKAYRIDDGDDLRVRLRTVLSDQGPWLCDVRLDPGIGLEPRASSKMLADGRMASMPIEDMYPFLDREEFRANMVIPPVEDA